MNRYPWSHLAAEFLGTGLLVAAGLSFVILDLGPGTAVATLLPDPGVRRLLTGFLFGSTGGLIAVSPLGRVSGGHINPAVTSTFWLMGRMRGGHALGYVAAQLAGGAAGAVPLLAWGAVGRAIAYGATVPGPGYSPAWAFAGEAATTFTMIMLLLFFVSRKTIRRFTPLIFPFLYAVMVFLEAPVSGTSTNPARSLGPAIISGTWRAWWVYWAGPLSGVLLAVGVHTRTWLGRLEVEVAKLYHFEHDPLGVFRWRRHGEGSGAGP